MEGDAVRIHDTLHPTHLHTRCRWTDSNLRKRAEVWIEDPLEA